MTDMSALTGFLLAANQHRCAAGRAARQRRESDRFTYRCVHTGDVGRFRGEETIHRDGRLTYTAWFGGGLVDQRQGD